MYKKIIGDAVQVVFHLFTADGTVNIHDKRLVCVQIFKNAQVALLPSIVVLFALQNATGFFLKCPFNEVVNILKVIVKRHAADAAVICNIADGDFIERLFKQLIFKRSDKRTLCDLRHSKPPAVFFLLHEYTTKGL